MGASGKSVEFLGGRTTRPSARKIRSNKVNTTKGLRDRRVRLSADTAIQFYDVQDRLGYERATEAIDWLIEKAKGSIDMLFDTSSQHYAHLVHQGDIDGQDGYQAENLCSRGEFEESVYVQNFYSPGYHSENISECNFMGSSGVFPHVHMPNNAPDLSYRMSLKPYRFEDSGFHSASSSILKHGCMSRFGSKLIIRNEKDEPVLNSAPMLLKSPADDSNYDLSLAHSPNGVNITSVQCLAPAYESADRGLLSGQVPNLYNSTQSRQYQEHLMEVNHPFFPMPDSRSIDGSTIGI